MAMKLNFQATTFFNQALICTSSMLSSLTLTGLFFCFGAGFGLVALAALAFFGDCGFFSFPLAGVLD